MEQITRRLHLPIRNKVTQKRKPHFTPLKKKKPCPPFGRAPPRGNELPPQTSAAAAVRVWGSWLNMYKGVSGGADSTLWHDHVRGNQKAEFKLDGKMKWNDQSYCRYKLVNIANKLIIQNRCLYHWTHFNYSLKLRKLVCKFSTMLKNPKIYFKLTWNFFFFFLHFLFFLEMIKGFQESFKQITCYWVKGIILYPF